MDLDTLTVPDNPFDQGREVFDAVHAWDGAPQRIVISVIRVGPQPVLQIGYDFSTDFVWFRSLAAPGEAWSAWTRPGTAEPAAPPPDTPA